jgi:hypothetical protein
VGAVIASVTMFVSTLASSTDPTNTGATRIPDPDTVSPGFAGFLAVFVVAVATVLLIRSMTKHMRKVKFLAEERDREELENALKDDSAQIPGQR